MVALVDTDALPEKLKRVLALGILHPTQDEGVHHLIPAEGVGVELVDSPEVIPKAVVEDDLGCSAKAV